jgi:hypothetical protein
MAGRSRRKQTMISTRSTNRPSAYLTTIAFTFSFNFIYSFGLTPLLWRGGMSERAKARVGCVLVENAGEVVLTNT